MRTVRCCLLAAASAFSAAMAHAQVAGAAKVLRDMAPVTDAMLRDPPPADWLHWRHIYGGWGYSPLDQGDHENAHDMNRVGYR